MPELPEVETTRLAITPYLQGETIKHIVTRHHQLRLPIAPEMQTICSGQKIHAITRRAKYLILQLSKGYLLIHLGMSGHLRIIPKDAIAGKHDHIDLHLTNDYILRYNDPRRFGLWLYLTENPVQHALLTHLGPEPLSDNFNADYLLQRAHKKSLCIKSFIMNNEVVVGVGNIYASESLYLAGIHPLQAAGSITFSKFELLTGFIKKVLQQAITAGGTTLRDFYSPDGKPGYFANNLQVYGRKDAACFACKNRIKIVRIAGRSSAFCPQCQPLSSVKS